MKSEPARLCRGDSFDEILDARLTRRDLLRGSLGLAAAASPARVRGARRASPSFWSP